jgi:hypothetical protein
VNTADLVAVAFAGTIAAFAFAVLVLGGLLNSRVSRRRRR